MEIRLDRLNYQRPHKEELKTGVRETMKYQWKAVGSLLLILLMMGGLTGCTEQNSQDPLHPTATAVQAILAKATAIDSMYYEINGSLNVTAFVSEVLSMKVWDKEPYLKEKITVITAGIPTTLVLIQRPEGTYYYNGTKYMLTSNIPSYITAFKYIDPEMIKDLLNNQSITDFETEVLDGKQTTLINYTLPLQGGHSITVTVWIWNDMGVPLKAIVDMNTEAKMSIDIIFNNYSFNSIPDSEFDVS
jgi:hypothetical protein